MDCQCTPCSLSLPAWLAGESRNCSPAGSFITPRSSADCQSAQAGSLRYNSMKKRLLDYLACPSCGSSIHLRSVQSEDGIEIISGELECTVCQRTFAIRRGVPRFADLAEMGAGKQATAENFGWSWQEFSHEDEKYGDELLGWLAPVRPEFCQGKAVLEGGCGKGRHTHRIARWGARDIVAV